MRTPNLLLLALLGALCATTAAADAGDDRLRRCADLDDDAERLTCYDDALRPDAAPAARASAAAASAAQASAVEASAVEEAIAAKPPAKPVSVPVAEAPARSPEPRAAAEDRFGLDAPAEPEREELDELGANITKIEVRRNGERIFTLDNGQVWAEKSPSPSLRLQVGDRVTIKSGLFGSHRLFGTGKRSSGVDRVR